MPAPVHLTPLDPSYPSRLRALADPPASITTRGGPLEAEHVIAVVGSREASREALVFARELAAQLAQSGVVVASGGAHGIDAAAHEGALDAGGRTWAIAGTGLGHCYPAAHAELFERIGQGPGAMLWPFGVGYNHRSAFLVRNHVLVGLADAVVVVQAGLASGALHAATCAQRLKRALWVVTAAPWMHDFAGSLQLIDQGARPLISVATFLTSVTGVAGQRPSLPVVRRAPFTIPVDAPIVTGGDGNRQRSFSPAETKVLDALSQAPLHLDAIASRSAQAAQAVSAALFTLALENVVVEGPPGFFRRRDPRKHLRNIG